VNKYFLKKRIPFREFGEEVGPAGFEPATKRIEALFQFGDNFVLFKRQPFFRGAAIGG
jgi:hypothetical protein